MKKRLFVLAFALAFTVGLAWAGGDHGQMDIAGHVAKLKTDLKLTDQQAEKVRTLLEDIHKRKMEAKEKAGGQDTPELREQVNKLMAERDSRLKEILTPQQFTQYQELQAKQAKEHAAAAHKK
jgi:Spy/CpxP family protein refolding chaperone